MLINKTTNNRRDDNREKEPARKEEERVVEEEEEEVKVEEVEEGDAVDGTEDIEEDISAAHRLSETTCV
ncbi:unnamed protein product [Boreogadus saida]